MPSATLPETALPIYDFSHFSKGDTEGRKETSRQVVDAFKTYGFVYLVNHGISKERIRELFDWVGPGSHALLQGLGQRSWSNEAHISWFM